MIVRIPYLPSAMGERLYDLSDGSLSMKPIGMIGEDREVYSAEQLLNDLGEFNIGSSINIIITGFTDEDVKAIE